MAACLSTPALPESTSSQSKAFNLKLSPLPNAVSTLSMREQLQSHREKAVEINDILTSLRDSAPSLKTKGKIVYQYFYRERYLEREVKSQSLKIT